MTCQVEAQIRVGPQNSRRGEASSGVKAGGRSATGRNEGRRGEVAGPTVPGVQRRAAGGTARLRQ